MAKKERLALRTVTGIPISVVLVKTPGKWTLLPEGSQKRFIFEPAPGRGSLFPDPWNVREVFLRVSEEAEVLQFLQQTGKFSSAQSLQSGHFDLDFFGNFQALIRELLRRPPSTWRRYAEALDPRMKQVVRELIADSGHFGVRFYWKMDKTSMLIETHDLCSSLIGTIYLDHLRQMKYGFCARLDCRKPYEITSRHRRRYCSPYCAHLEGLRRMRKKRRKKGRNVPRNAS